MVSTEQERVCGPKPEGTFWRREKFLFQKGIEPGSLRRQARSPVNIPNTLSLFVLIAGVWN
jgi:hypothetical protein